MKVFKGIAWEEKLAEFVNAFKEHRDALSKDLIMHTSVGIFRLNQKFASFSSVFQSASNDLAMLLLFHELRSPEERKLRKFIENHGGPEAFLNDDAMMGELLSRTEKNLHHSPPEQMKMAKDLQRELSMDLKDIIEADEDGIGNKFLAIQEQIIMQLESAIRREGDRIISNILSGPRDRLLDPVLFLHLLCN